MNRKLTKLAEMRARRAAQLGDSGVEESYEITDPKEVGEALAAAGEGGAESTPEDEAEAPEGAADAGADGSLEDEADPEQVIISETEDTTVIEVEVKPKRRTRTSK